MKTYNKILFYTDNQSASEILMARLEDEGFYAFEIEENYLAAYIEAKNFNMKKLNEIFKEKIKYKIESIEDENWNTQWEQSFEPVIIEDFVAIRAQFHPPVTNVLHEIIITPKMSFGTGHHATTSLMVREMRKIDFEGKGVIDFGTGTGLLAILAELSGAESITAIDNDPWSIANATENVRENNCTKITLIESSDLENLPQADIILANINRNILLLYSSSIANHLEPSGKLLISGFLNSDEQDMIATFSKIGLKTISSNKQGDWVVLQMEKT